MAKVIPFETAVNNPNLLKHASMWKPQTKELQTMTAPRIRNMSEYRDIKCIIYPDDMFISAWNLILVLLLLYTAIITPYRISFSEDDSTAWIIVDICVDLLFFNDVVVNCFTAYYDNEMNLVVDRRKILMRYFKGWMIIDVIACVPLQIILEADTDYSSLVIIARLPRLYRLIKMTKLIRGFKTTSNRNKLMKFAKSVLHIPPGIERLLWFIGTFILMIHIFCCIWIFIGKFNSDSYDNWIHAQGMNDHSNFEMYTTSFYWAVTTLATVGYGDIRAYNTNEMIVCCIVMILGVFLYSYTIGSITALISNLDSRKAQMNRKLEILHDLAKEYKLNKVFYKKLTNAIEYENRRSRADLNELLKDLPVHLRTQLLIIIYQKMLENNVFFENKPPYFVAWIAPLLKPLQVDKGEYIFKADEFATEMYFLVSGEVAMVIQKGDISIPFLLMFDGYYFGEIDLLFTESKKHMYSIRTMTKCELLTLSRNDFENMLRQFENEALDILSRAKERLQRTKEKHQKAEEEIKENIIVRRYSSIPDSTPLVSPPEALWSLKNLVKDKETQDKQSECMSETEDILKQTLGPNPSLINVPEIITTTMTPSMENPEFYTPRESALSSISESQPNVSKEPSILKTGTLFKTFVDEKLGTEYEEIKEIKQKIKKMDSTIYSINSMVRLICESLNITDIPQTRHRLNSSSNTSSQPTFLSLTSSIKGFLSPGHNKLITEIEEARITEEHEESSTY